MQEREENQMAEMPIYENVEKIAQLNTVWENLVLLLEQELDAEGIDWRTAVVVSGLRADGDYLYEDGTVIAENEGEYYVNQSEGIVPDHYFGVLYYRTETEGQYVRVNYDMY